MIRITKESSTLLDLFATNTPKNVTLATVIPSTLSDHDLLVVVRKINVGKLPPHSIECRNFSNYDQMTFTEDLKKCSWDDVYRERDANSAWSIWKELFLSVCNKHAPIRHKVLIGIIYPWLTSTTLFCFVCHKLYKAKKSNYLNSHGEEAQKKPPDLKQKSL